MLKSKDQRLLYYLSAKTVCVYHQECEHSTGSRQTQHQWRIQGADGAMAPFCLTVNFFWLIFVKPFAMNHKICVPRLQWLSMFLPKNCIKIHPNLSFWGQTWFFWNGVQPLHHKPPLSTLTAPRPSVLKSYIRHCTASRQKKRDKNSLETKTSRDCSSLAKSCDGYLHGLATASQHWNACRDLIAEDDVARNSTEKY